jgi:hypothetical protein
VKKSVEGTNDTKEGTKDSSLRFNSLLATNESIEACPMIAACHGVETMTSILFESVSEHEVSGGSGGLKNTRSTHRRRNGLS